MEVVAKAITNPETVSSPCLVVPIFSAATTAKSGSKKTASSKLSKVAKQLDQATNGVIQQLVTRGDGSGELGKTLLIPSVTGIKAERILLVGCGSGKALSAADFKTLVNKTLTALEQGQINSSHLLIDELAVEEQDQAWMAAQFIQTGISNSYRYRKTLSKPKAAASLKRLTVNFAANKAISRTIAEAKAIAQGMNVAKELGNLPGNICTPTYLAQQAKSLGRKHKSLSISVVEEKAMRELGMGSLLSVTAGTSQPAKLIVMEYKGAAKSQRPHVLVGKGITFDSGGISLKPGAKMDEMKYDMCGAASVVGTMHSVAALGLKINVVAVIAAAENMPSSNATKPGDVVTSMSGQTIEVLNTDAEGRLVLCDALTYAERFKPQSIIDIATLTGACVVALGKHASGLYSNQDDFAQELLAAGQQAGDRAWHMPMWDEYQPQLDSNFADIANIGGPEGGSITAACFLSRFTKNMRWAHLDIAGTAWVSGGNKGATGRPVGLLTQYLINQS